MSEPVEALVRDLVEWIARKPRPYSEVMDTWRTSCPRLPVWEEAVDRGLVERRIGEDRSVYVVATASGLSLLAEATDGGTALTRRP